MQESFVPKVSIILPSYNVKAYIRECLQSVINQSLNEIEIICVDAGSTDGTLEIINEYAENDKRIKIINSDKKSYGYQMNLGISKANGEYIGIVETDDFIDNRMYEELYDYAVKTKAEVVKGPYIEYSDSNNYSPCYYSELLNKIFPKNICFTAQEYGEILTFHPSIWSGIYSRDYLRRNNILFLEKDGAAYVDVLFRIQTCINTRKVAWYDKEFYYYRINNPNSSSNVYNISEMINRWKEIHEYLSSKQDFCSNYAKYLITDEYDGTLNHIGKLKINNDDYLQLIHNFNNYSDEIINEAYLLADIKKERLKSFLNDPEKFYKDAYRFYSLKHFINKGIDLFFPKGSVRRAQLKQRVLFNKNGAINERG